MLAFIWKFLTAVACALVIVTALMNALMLGAPTWLFVAGMILSYVVVAWVALEIVRVAGRKDRERVEGVKVVEVAHH
jgi:hypothetical protein